MKRGAWLSRALAVACFALVGTACGLLGLDSLGLTSCRTAADCYGVGPSGPGHLGLACYRCEDHECVQDERAHEVRLRQSRELANNDAMPLLKFYGLLEAELGLWSVAFDRSRTRYPEVVLSWSGPSTEADATLQYNELSWQPAVADEPDIDCAGARLAWPTFAPLGQRRLLVATVGRNVLCLGLATTGAPAAAKTGRVVRPASSKGVCTPRVVVACPDDESVGDCHFLTVWRDIARDACDEGLRVPPSPKSVRFGWVQGRVADPHDMPELQLDEAAHCAEASEGAGCISAHVAPELAVWRHEGGHRFLLAYADKQGLRWTEVAPGEPPSLPGQAVLSAVQADESVGSARQARIGHLKLSVGGSHALLSWSTPARDSTSAVQNPAAAERFDLWAAVLERQPEGPARVKAVQSIATDVALLHAPQIVWAPQGQGPNGGAWLMSWRENVPPAGATAGAGSIRAALLRPDLHFEAPWTVIAEGEVAFPWVQGVEGEIPFTFTYASLRDGDLAFHALRCR